MNPRDFAREPGYDLTIALTYSFDPVFFENVVLHDLRVGGSGSIVIVGDPHEVDAAWPSQMRNGRWNILVGAICSHRRPTPMARSTRN